MDKKLVLVSPSYQYRNKSLRWLAKSITVAPPLGLLYVAEAAKSIGWSVEIIDSEMEEYSLETVVNEVISAAPDLVGITVTTPFLQSAIQISEGVKKIHPLKSRKEKYKHKNFVAELLKKYIFFAMHF